MANVEPFVKTIAQDISHACKPLRDLQKKVQTLDPHGDKYPVFLGEFYRLENKIRKVWNYKECIYGPKYGPCKEETILPCDACDGENYSKSQGNKLSK